MVALETEAKKHKCEWTLASYQLPSMKNIV